MLQNINADLSYIKKLSDRPGEDGLTANEIKEEFDKGVNYLKDFINTQIINVLNTSGSEQIGSTAISGLSGSTIYSQLLSIKSKLPPVGAVFLFAGSTLPENLLLCDGRAVSRSTYASLFSAIGTQFGARNGTTTFTLPNLTNSNLSASIRYVIAI